MILETFTLIIIVTTARGMTCTNNPCMYGVCQDVENSYKCYCIDGYTGVNCEINSNECWSNPCLNGGTCIDGIANYNCICFEGFTGKQCEIDVSVCNETSCQNNGTCKEGFGTEYSCDCLNGWTGEYCEEDINECLHSPCQNGGLCMNLQPSYTCVCLFGFTGKNCDETILPCETNTCENNALCLLEDGRNVCYCVPNYHGVSCELKYDNCEQWAINCQNGGTCINNFVNFTCNCLPQYTGRFCTFELDADSTTIYSTSTSSYSTPISVYSTSNLSTSTSSLVYSTSNLSTLTSIYSTSTSIYSTTNLSTSNHSTSTSVYSTPVYSTPVYSTSDNSTAIITSEVSPTYSDFTELDEITEGTTLTSKEDVSTLSEEFSTTEIVSTTTGRTFQSSTEEVGVKTKGTVRTEQTEETLSTQQFTNITSTTESTSSQSTEFPPFSTPFFVSEITKSSTLGTYETPQITMGSLPGTSTPRAIQTDSQLLVGTQSVTQSLTDHMNHTVETDDTLTGERFTTAARFSTSSSTFSFSTTSSSPSSNATNYFTEYEESESTSTTVPQDTTDFSPSTVDVLSSPSYNMSQCGQSDCSVNFCLQSGSCQCFNEIKNVGFNGTSFVRHNLLIANNDTLLINISLVTKSKNGIILHTLFDNERYALLHLRLGQLQLQLSCGSQKILFGTIDVPINNGYVAHLALSLQYILDDPLYKCIAKLYVNNTVIMSGEQVILSYDLMPRAVKLYLGGIPVAVPYYMSHAGLGFVGCLSSLNVNNIPRHLIRDAAEIHLVSNCKTFNCFLNPCENFGYCEDLGGDIKCNCLPGYIGKYCEKSVCENNPCHLGSTCVTFPGSTFICVCPLGKHGLLCEKDLEVTVPSFSTILPGLSSYMAFGLKDSLNNYLELSLRIKPQFNEQISLIAYIGQSNLKKNIPDYFAVTFVQGYLMLTWDLGSGVRRIFTETPLNTETRKFHNLNIGRRGKFSWLHVEGIGNVSGSSDGPRTNLDVSSILYIGGHKSRNFDKLPHDLPLHTGFIGCISDIQMRTEDNFYEIQESNHVVGRNVGQCDFNECSDNVCNNGAVCLNHGPSYRCLCMKGWEGPDCTTQSYIPSNFCSTI